MIDYYFKNSSSNNLPIISERSYFTSNYDLRIYASGCYYLDKNNQWQSDGLLVSLTFFYFLKKNYVYLIKVGPITNLYQTQCFSTHLNQVFSIFIPDVFI